MNQDSEYRGRALKNLGIFSLLIAMPNIGDWKQLSQQQMLQAMGGDNYKGRRQLIEKLAQAAGSFPCDDSLPSYSGLGMRQYAMGSITTMVHTRLYNRRLKDAFMTAARNIVLYDSGCDLAGYYRNLLKAGMQPLEATKRVARVLVRTLFRELSALVHPKPADQDQEAKEGESGMASATTRGDQGHQSNMPPSCLTSTKTKSAKKVKARCVRGEGRKSSGRRRAALKKSA